MKLPSRALIVLAIPFCVVILSQRANAQVKTESKVAEATVSGKVTIKGKPAAGIVVGMRLARPEQFSQTYKARTDQEGVYRISRVTTGNYLVAPAAPAYVIPDSASGGQGQSVVITETENVEGINFELVPGGVITGKVTDSEGHPLIEERVSLMPADERDQRRPFYFSGSVSGMVTDDRGAYRIFGVPAGRYKLSVGDPGFNTGNRRRATLQTFYPDVTDISKAGVVEVKEGSEANKIDITIGEAPQGYSVTGRVVDGESGKAIVKVYLHLTRIEVTDGSTRRFTENVDVPTDAQGQFRLTNVRPGKYDLNVYEAAESNLRMDAPARFDVIDQDLSGLVIKTSKGATIAGTVVFEGSKGSPVPPPRQMWLGVYTRSEGPNSAVSSSGASGIKPDGTFFAGGLTAGVVNFNIENDKGFNLTRVERDGVPQPNGIQIQNGEHVSGVRLVMTISNGSIRGVVRIENGTLPPAARIMIQLQKAGEQVQSTRGAEVDARGHFLIEGLAAGSYELRATAYSPDMQRQRVRPPTSAKQIVIVNDGAAAEVTLTLDLTPTPNQ